MSDRLALAHAIEDAGIPRDKAEQVATAIARFVEGSAATQADVQAAEATVEAAIRTETMGIRGETTTIRALIASETSRLDTRIERLDAKVELIGHRLLTRLGGLVIVVVGALFAALHAWPPH